MTDIEREIEKIPGIIAFLAVAYFIIHIAAFLYAVILTSNFFE